MASLDSVGLSITAVDTSWLIRTEYSTVYGYMRPMHVGSQQIEIAPASVIRSASVES